MIDTINKESVVKDNLELTKLKENIIELQRSTNQNYYRMGNLLNEIKDKLEHSEFSEWVKKELDISHNSCNRYMKIAKHYDEQVAINLGVKKAYLLLKIKDSETRQQFIEENNATEKSYEELVILVQEHLKQCTSEKSKKEYNYYFKSLKKTLYKHVERVEDSDIPFHKKYLIKECFETIIKSIEDMYENEEKKAADSITDYASDIDHVEEEDHSINLHDDWLTEDATSSSYDNYDFD